jgi:anti-anti-sigma factor
MSEPNELTLEIEVLADTAIVRCRGALTLTSAGRLRHEVKRLFVQARVVTVDFTDLKMIDSFGLGTMASLYVSARNAGRDLYVVNMGPRVRELFSVTRLLSLFEQVGDFGVRIP